MRVERSTYAFAAVFPFFTAERVVRQARRRVGRPAEEGLTKVSPRMDRLLMGLSRAEMRMLPRRNLPFGSSVFLAAVKPPG